MANIDFETAALLLTQLGLTTALSDALVLLGRTKRKDDLSWLDEFEEAALNAIKNASIEGVSLETDAALVARALDYVSFALQQARYAVANRENVE